MNYVFLKKMLIIPFLFSFLFLGNECGFVADKTIDNHVSLNNSNKTILSKKELQEHTPVVVKKKQNLESYGYGYGDIYLQKYSSVFNVKQIILIEQSKRNVSDGFLYLFCKDKENQWKLKLTCNAFLGKNGIDKVVEGDKKTPTGDFGFFMAFGIKDNPGSLISYTKLTDTMYLCGDKEFYNQFIDVSKMQHTCGNNSEHLIRYVPQYNYALFIDYNKDCIYGKGSAIFLHCTGNYPYTLGCISLSEEHMVKIIRLVDSNARICIYANRIN